MATIQESVDSKTIPVYIMGKRYEVPETLTIMKAMEHAGYQFIRGCGCRGGVCGACSTVYRKEGDYKIYSGLACQTVVEPGMHLTQLPFFPALRAIYDYAKIEATAEAIQQLYPELFRCVACNACTKICPMDVQVLDYVSALKRGDIAAAAEISFDCIQCGLCASRCFGEIPQYHIAQLARRLHGGKIKPRSEHMAQMVEDVSAGKYDGLIDDLKKLDADALRDAYTSREMEPAMSEEGWTPDNREGLLG
jgi:succinate dehydrogenase/fumarate reductase-like Fe-S protein